MGKVLGPTQIQISTTAAGNSTSHSNRNDDEIFHLPCVRSEFTLC